MKWVQVRGACLARAGKKRRRGMRLFLFEESGAGFCLMRFISQLRRMEAQ
jgi:hypothetical protein